MPAVRRLDVLPTTQGRGAANGFTSSISQLAPHRTQQCRRDQIWDIADRFETLLTA